MYVYRKMRSQRYLRQFIISEKRRRVVKGRKKIDQDERTVHELRRAMFSLYTFQQGLCIRCSQQRIVEFSVPPRPHTRPRREISGQQYRPVAPGWCRGSCILGVGPRHAPGIRVDQTEHCAHLCSVPRLRVDSVAAAAVVKAKREKRKRGETDRPLDIIILLRERNVVLARRERAPRYSPFFATCVVTNVLFYDFKKIER